MTTVPPLEVKVIYTASSRTRRRRRSTSVASPTRSSSLILLGLLNLTAAGGLYYATWQWADPELRFKLIMHTPIPGLDVGTSADKLVSNPSPAGKRAPLVRITPSSASDTEAQTTRAVLFVGTIMGWEALCTLAACTLALSGGALLGRIRRTLLRRGLFVLGLTGLAALGWAAWELWHHYERFVPDHLRVAMAAVVVLAALAGLTFGRGGRRLTYLAAMAVILSAAGSAGGLYIGAQFNAIKPQDIPLPFLLFLAVVFIVHSLWGWILLPLASRVTP